MFYNTNNETGAKLKESHAKAESQETLIMAFFRENPDKMFSPDDVYNIFDSTKTPISSIKRAITDLCKDGHLIKTDIMKMGSYGKFCHCWKLKTI